jgi:putative membrane protein
VAAEILEAAPILLSDVVVGSVLARRALVLRRQGRPVPRIRIALVATGLLMATAAVAAPVDRTSDDHLWAHMGQHLLLGDVAPFLLALGLDGRWLRPLLAAPGLRSFRRLARPLPALALWTAAIAVWHLPAAYDAAVRIPLLHDLEHLCFFWTGLLAWTVALETLPGRRGFGAGVRIAYLAAMRAGSMALAFVLLFAAPIYPHYPSADEQRAAGGVMLLEGAIVGLLAFACLFLGLLHEAAATQALREQGVAEERAGRAGRYGRIAES